MQNQDELYHYGVLGMKWGVRRDRSGTINKSFKKMDKLDRNIDKASVKATKATMRTVKGASRKYQKFERKAAKYQGKANKKKYGWFPNAEKATKYQMKADRFNYKASKKKAKHLKREAKSAKMNALEKRSITRAHKWAEQMNKTIGPMKPTELSSDQIRLGRKYLGM